MNEVHETEGVFLGVSGDLSPEVAEGQRILTERLKDLLGEEFAHEALRKGVARKIYSRLTPENLESPEIRSRLRAQVAEALAQASADPSPSTPVEWEFVRAGEIASHRAATQRRVFVCVR